MRIDRRRIGSPVQPIHDFCSADTSREPGHDAEHVRTSALKQLGRRRDGHPELPRLGVQRHESRVHRPCGKRHRRHDANDRVRLAAQAERVADDVLASSQPLLPEPVREHDHAVAPGRLFVRHERPTEERPNTQRVEVVGRHPDAADGGARIRRVNAESCRAEQRDRRQTVCGVTPGCVAGAGHARRLPLAVTLGLLPHEDELVGRLERQRAPEHSGRGAKSSGGGGQADGQRDHDGDREKRPPAYVAQGPAKVVSGWEHHRSSMVSEPFVGRDSQVIRCAGFGASAAVDARLVRPRRPSIALLGDGRLGHGRRVDVDVVVR
jgi:hypothetical protein